MKYKYALITLLLFLTCTVSYALKPPYGTPEWYTRLGASPVLGFYSVYQKHAINPSAKMSFNFFIKRERSIGFTYKAFVSVGAEYFVHGLNFRSYYFTQDTLQIYTGDFPYRYSLYIHELQFPIQVKFTANSTLNSRFTPYFSLGYSPRILLLGSVNISQEGTDVFGETVSMKFKHPLFSNKINSCIQASLGIQTNRSRGERNTFFAEIFFRYGFSPYYFETAYAASSLYINSSHLGLTVGIAF